MKIRRSRGVSGRATQGGLMGMWSDWLGKRGLSKSPEARKGGVAAPADDANPARAEGGKRSTAQSAQDQALADACKERRWEEAAALMEVGAQGSALADGHPALFWAALGGRLELVEPLAKGPVWSLGEERGETPLMAAAAHGHLDVAKALAKSGARLDARDRSGQSALSFAAEAGAAPLVAWLLSQGVEPSEAALRGAARSGDLALARTIHEAGARIGPNAMPLAIDLLAQSKELSPRERLRAAFRYGVGPSALERGAPVGSREPATLEALAFALEMDGGMERDHRGRTALMVAARAGQDWAVKFLMDKGDPNLVDADGFTALMAAAYSNKPECAMELLKGRSEELGPLDFSAAVIAAEMGHFACAKMIWEQLPREGWKASAGKALAACAAASPRSGDPTDPVVVELARMAGAVADPKELSTALMIGIQRNNLDVVDVLFPRSSAPMNALVAMEMLSLAGQRPTGTLKGAQTAMDAMVRERALAMLESAEMREASESSKKIGAETPALGKPRL